MLSRIGWLLILLCFHSCQAGFIDWWDAPGKEAGRQNRRHHSPRCCFAHDCLLQDRGQHAIVTTLRTPNYLVLVRELHCSLTKYNPGVRFIVASVAKDLDALTIREVESFAEYREIEEVPINNTMLQRFSKNWCKLRIFGWDDLDSIILMDSDMVVRGDLTHIFHLPTDFAWTMDSGPGMEIEQGGFIFMRPCQAVAADMINLALSDEALQFRDGFAEQQFLQWYFRYSGIRLSSMYNMDFEVMQRTEHRTAGGAKPLVVHFAFDKPFDALPNDPRYQYLCWQPQQRRQTQSKSAASRIRGF